MSIRNKLFLSFVMATLLPILFIGAVSFHRANNAIEQDRIAALETIADFKVERIEAFFAERKDDIKILQHEPAVITNTHVWSTAQGEAIPQSATATVREILDSHLRPFQKVHGYIDIMLVNTQGEIVYVANESHWEKDLGKILPDPGNRAFEMGKRVVYVSDIFKNERASGIPCLLITGPIHDSSGKWMGVIALEINMVPIYDLIQDTSGLGETGETLIGKKLSDTALFLSPRRHDHTTSLPTSVKFGNKISLSFQKAVQGENGHGFALDYRNKKVIAAWRYISSLDWGMVAKIDTVEAFATVTEMRNFMVVIAVLTLIIVGMICSVIAKSITEPIRVLKDGMVKVCQGNLDHRVELKSHGEVTALADHFNEMVHDLKTRGKRLDDLKSALDEAAIVAITDQKGIIEYVNDKFCEISKYSSAELIGQDHRIINSGSHSKAFIKEMWTTIANGKVWHGHFKNKAKDGSIYWVDSTIVPFLNEKGKPYQYLSIRTDMTQQKQSEERVHLLAHYDELSGLPNRSLFYDRLNQVFRQQRREKLPFAVMFLDLDRFKLINDTLGHSTGDKLLQEVAGRLKGCLRVGDTVARMGGDEFTILLPEITKEKDVFPVAQRIIATLKEPFNIGENELFVTGSIGISLYPKNGEDSETLMKNADTAMYLAKKKGRGQFTFYSPDPQMNGQQSLALDAALRHALDREEFVLHYQPLVDLKTGRIIGMEALIRWERQGTGMVSPAEFIPLAEETGMILPIGEWVLETATRQLKTWTDAGYTRMTISVNVSALQFQAYNFSDQVGRMIESSGIDPSALKLEVTESILMQNQDEVVSRMGRLKEIGVQFAIDDFGTGYSSLSYLKRFPVESLKIDRAFVQHLPDDPDDTVIADTIITLGHKLGLNVVAEGIETEAQLVFLKGHGCNVGQGYLFSRPLPEEGFTALLEETRKQKSINKALFGAVTV